MGLAIETENLVSLLGVRTSANVTHHELRIINLTSNKVV